MPKQPSAPASGALPGRSSGPPEGRPFGILFACVGNAGRSQMAHGFAKALGGARVAVRSGGSRPAGAVMPEAIEAMREKGIDIAHHRSQGFDEAWIREHCDLVVTMGCGDDACPAFIGKRMEDWALEDPKGKPLAEVRRLRDEIERRVRALLRERGLDGA